MKLLGVLHQKLLNPNRKFTRPNPIPTNSSPSSPNLYPSFPKNTLNYSNFYRSVETRQCLVSTFNLILPFQLSIIHKQCSFCHYPLIFVLLNMILVLLNMIFMLLNMIFMLLNMILMLLNMILWLLKMENGTLWINIGIKQTKIDVFLNKNAELCMDYEMFLTNSSV